MARARFVGTWKLASYEYRGQEGEVVYPYGSAVSGIIHYDESGHMAAQLSRHDRGSFATGDPLGGTAAEIQEAFEGYFAYFGRYDVDEAAQTVTHHVEACLLPNWEGEDQVRSYEFSGNRLILRALIGQIGGGESHGTFVWERAGK